MIPLPTGTPPCPFMATGKLCGRTDDRPIVMDPLLGPICLEHRAGLVSKPKPKAEVAA